MSAGSTVLDSNESDRKPRIERARDLCAEALEICDALNLSPDIGAKLQEVINALDVKWESLKPRKA